MAVDMNNILKDQFDVPSTLRCFLKVLAAVLCEPAPCTGLATTAIAQWHIPFTEQRMLV